MTRIRDQNSFSAVRSAGLVKFMPNRPRIAVGMGTCGSGNGAGAVYDAFADAIERRGLDIQLVGTGCFGFCAEEPLVNVWIPGLPLVVLRRVQPNNVHQILGNAAAKTLPIDMALCRIESWDHLTAQINYGTGLPSLPLWHEVPFFRGQKKIVLRNSGLINPSDLEEYVAIGGYQTLNKVLTDGTPEMVLEQIKASKLRGRGGAGFPTGVKWEILRKTEAERKYLICNADEGDPGAYMNRNQIEGDPHSLIEGMLIGAYVTGATHGVIYVRAEYPLAVRRLREALAQAREYGVLGDDVLGRGFAFDIDLVAGAGAFVCGEETALIHSLEGRSGRPRPRPPYPSEQGLWGYPTNINNVETWFNIVPIVAKGPAWFCDVGTVGSAGTKVFSLVGKVKNTGLVEMPFGATLSSLVFEVGDGSPAGHPIKAVQTGGPSGGCVPRALLDTPVDYESLVALGSIMGSGGMVVMDDDNCMVDVARYFIAFMRSESCGKCVPCRVGLDKALDVLNRIAAGKGKDEDLQLLDDLGRMIGDTSLCGLGQTAPNSILTALKHFREEFEEHIKSHRCSAGICRDLYVSPCENSCPLHMNIPGYLELYAEGRIEDAFLSVILENPLPASTGRICLHPCDQRCRRKTVDDTVNMRDVHRLIADEVLLGDLFEPMLARVLERRLPSTGRKVAVAGAGPAGLTAAFYLALLGHDVTVFEAHADAGGMLRYALPEFRLPKAVLDKEIEIIRRLGVQFVYNTRVSVDITLNELNTRFDAVFLSIGTWKPSWVYLPGTELTGVVPALSFLDSIAGERPFEPGSRAVVIGGDNSAIDAARTALRLGCSVTVAYRRERASMPAIAEEVVAAEKEGVKFVFQAAPRRIVGQQGVVKSVELSKTRLGLYDASGRRRPIETEDIQILRCDSVILAVGEKVDLDFCAASGLMINEYGMLKVDRHTRGTSREKFFAGGDLVTGASALSNAMGQGKDAALSIDRFLTGEDRAAALATGFVYKMEVPATPDPSRRRKPRELSAKDRTGSFKEAVLGLSAADALTECARCLRCDIRDPGGLSALSR